MLVRADDNVLSYINTSTAGGVLQMSLDRGSFRRVTMEVDITLPTLDRLTLNDATQGQLSAHRR